MVQLGQGMKVQEASANLMSFLIQDLLDFAQIKSDKFRKNIGEFNIREAIDQVMCIQKHNIDENEIEFIATYDNILQEADAFIQNNSIDLIVKSNA